jgi:hypothetical protein
MMIAGRLTTASCLPELFWGVLEGQNSAVAAADKHLAASADKFQPVCAYFVGGFLEQHDQKADAIRYYRRCVDAPEVANIIFTTLAADRLRVLSAKQP